MTTPQERGPGIIVGLDGSPGSKAALAWATSAAEAFGVRLTAVRAYATPNDPYGGVLGPAPDILYDELRVNAEKELHQELSDVLGAERQDATARMVGGGTATDVLAAAAEGSELLVVGEQGQSRLGLGSTAEDLARHAPVPVVVVRSDLDADKGEDAPEAGRVVVAVGETEHSATTLEFAFRYASRTGHPITVLHVWDAPFYRISGKGAPAADVDPVEIYQADERRVLAEAVAQWEAKFPDVNVRISAVPGKTANIVIAASAGAALLVVGGRQRKLTGAITFGSIPHAAVHHAHCAVAVVPAASR